LQHHQILTVEQPQHVARTGMSTTALNIFET